MREVPSIVIPSTSEQFTRMPDIFLCRYFVLLRRRRKLTASSGIVEYRHCITVHTSPEMVLFLFTQSKSLTRRLPARSSEDKTLELIIFT